MALNWAMLKEDRTPVPLPHELFIRTIESGPELTLIIPNTPPSGVSTSGGSGGEKKLKESGRLWLSEQRVRDVSALLIENAAHALLSCVIVVDIRLGCPIRRPQTYL